MVKTKEKERSKLKNYIRTNLKSKRANLSRGFYYSASRKIKGNLVRQKEFTHCSTIACYLPVKKEADTWPIIKYAQKLRKKVFIPVINSKTRKITFYRLPLKKTDLILNKYKIPEPKKSLREPTHLSGIDLMLVPGIAFDKKGHRIGFGKGYFDRVLRKFKNEVIALAFDFQVIKKIPATKNDMRMDMIITEEKVIRVRSKKTKLRNEN